MRNRLGIFVIYDKQGIVDDYLGYWVKELKRVTNYLVVVSNHKLKDEMKSKLAAADCIFERDNVGFDVGAISAVLNTYLGWEKIYEYDEVLCLNDSVFGPFFSLENIFEEMDQEELLDFWGLTKRGISDFDGGEIIYPEHLQLYFYVVRRKMLHSEKYKEYWSNISKYISNFRSAVINYEFMFTKYFED